MSVDDDEGLIDRCDHEKKSFYYYDCRLTSDLGCLPDAHRDVLRANVLQTQADRTGAHDAPALTRESVQEHMSPILQVGKEENGH